MKLLIPRIAWPKNTSPTSMLHRNSSTSTKLITLVPKEKIKRFFLKEEEEKRSPPSTMRKPYRKGTVHPTPPLISDHLSFLPATILTLTAALSPEDREVLAYLISCSSTTFSSSGNRTTNRATAAKYGADHPTCFSCYCFRCYMSYWVRWDSSPNRQLIHEIIDAFEEGLLVQSKKEKTRRERRKIKDSSNGSGELKGSDKKLGSEDRSEFVSVEDNSNSSGGGAGSEDGADEEDFEKGSVRRFVNFLGQKIWSVLA